VAVAFSAFSQIGGSAAELEHTDLTIQRANALLSALKDAETGQRGYLLTGDETFLEPYYNARKSVRGQLDSLRQLAKIGTAQKRLDALSPMVDAKLAELLEVIRLYQAHNTTAAFAEVGGGRGKRVMDGIRAELGGFIAIEERALAQREAQAQDNTRRMYAIMAGASLLTLLLALAFSYFVHRDARHRQSRLEARLLHQNENILNRARLENSQRIAGLGDWEYVFADQRLVWSEEVYRIIGISREEFPPSSETFYGLVHPDDLAFVHREERAAADGSRRADFEHRIIRPDGRVRQIHQIAELILDGQGKPVRESGTIQDVTERKLSEEALRQSEERFKLAARAVSDVVWDWDLVTGSLWWSEGLTTAFGYETGEVEPGLDSWTSRIHSDDVHRIIDGLHHAVDAGAASWSAEYRFRCKSGDYALIQNRAYILRDATGKGIRMVGGMRDLTEEKKLEAQYLRAQRMNSIGTLAGGIAHDLNNVLAPIMMSIELLKKDPDIGVPRSKILNTIHVCCQRGADLVKQVLTFARGLGGAQVAIRLRYLIQDIEGIISETFPSNIKIVTETPNDLWPVMGDPSQLQQVLLNLAINARDAMPQGGTLTLTAANISIDAPTAGAAREAGLGPQVLLQVTDTGSGIPPEIRERIFEPFFTTKEPGKGTGLGLATVHTIIKNHHALLRVESEVGHGTTFKIYLPADPTLRADAAIPAVPDLLRGRGELVLVIDDESSIRNITQQTLEAFGYRVITAGGGAEAIALYAKRAGEIGVVITDTMMPVMNGVGLIKALIEFNPSARIIASSGFAVTAEVTETGSAKVSGFLAKPYTAQTLLRLLREVLDRPLLRPNRGPTAGSTVAKA